MGFKLFDDKIITPTISGDQVVLAPGSRLTIGGQQYYLASQLNTATLGTLTVGRMYFVYVTVVSNVLTLSASLILPSAQSGKLVGCFITSWDGITKTFTPIDQIPVIQYSATQSGGYVFNINIQGYLPMSGIEPYGLVRPEAGSPNSANGLWSISNPYLINPIPNARVHGRATVLWNPGSGNVSNTWTTFLFRNGGDSRQGQVDGPGASGASNLRFIQCPATGGWQNCTVGDYFQVLGQNNLGAVGTFLSEAHFRIEGIVAPKDM